MPADRRRPALPALKIAEVRRRTTRRTRLRGGLPYALDHQRGVTVIAPHRFDGPDWLKIPEERCLGSSSPALLGTFAPVPNRRPTAQ